MYNNIIEVLRKLVIGDIFETDTVNKCWNIWRDEIMTLLPPNYTAQHILNLGDHLSEIFKRTGSKGRGQGELSGGGTAWEALVIWYINLCCVGTRVVAIKKMGHLPSPIRDAINVNYSNVSCSSESDITVIVFPDDPIFVDENINLLKKNGKVNFNELSNHVGNSFQNFEVGIIQCKTNWNDNAQIPMLWDMIYSAGGFRGRQISVGRNNFSIQNLKTFTYSFVTVPTNKIASYKTTSVSVKRVQNLSGGNYWGRPTSNGIARSIQEIFQNYMSGYTKNDIRTTLISAISNLNENCELNYFKIKK